MAARCATCAIATPDPEAFPDFDENLREAFQRETELFLESQLREDRSVLELLTANYTFVNERLARHYGIPNVYGSHFRRVTFADDRRGGLLGQGSILTVTSYPNRTSPVVRGKWLLENILGAPPPPPPPERADAWRRRRPGRRSIRARADGAAPQEPGLRQLPRADGSAGLRARELRRDRHDGARPTASAPIDASGALPDGDDVRRPGRVPHGIC